MITTLTPANDTAGQPAATLAREVQRSQDWWRQQWLAFPTVSDEGGGLEFWDVPADTGVYQDDWPRGECLARDTITQMRRFPEGASVLRRILARLDHDSTVAQGFLNHLEEVLARPDLYPAEAPGRD
jgi:hypothetical protein